MGSNTALTVLSVSLYAGSVVSAVLATRRLGDKPFDENRREYAAAYAPATILFVSATALIAFSSIRSAKMLDSAMTAYTITREALDDLRSAVPVKLLNDAESRVLTETVEREFEPPVGSQLLIHPNVFCFDKTTGQSFVNSVENIHKACQALNYQIINHSMATMDDYCDELGLEHISGGGGIGWTSGPITFGITTRLKDDTIAVVVVSVSPLPNPLWK